MPPPSPRATQRQLPLRPSAPATPRNATDSRGGGGAVGTPRRPVPPPLSAAAPIGHHSTPGGPAPSSSPVKKTAGNVSTGRGEFSFSLGPAHARVDDFDEWYANLRYDPKKPTAAQLKAIRQAEADNVANARRNMSHTETQRHLLQLSSALRADLEIFVTHLLDSGGSGTAHSIVQAPAGQRSPKRQDTGGKRGTKNTNEKDDSEAVGDEEELSPTHLAAMEAQALTQEAYLTLKGLFDILDVDRSGTLTYDELRHAAVILGRDRYDESSFQALDKNRSGSIDFLEMLKVFFPRLTLRYLAKCQREFGKHADAMRTARSRLAPEYVAQLERQYAQLSRLPGGCTVDNMLVSMSNYMRRNRHILQEVFDTFDTDGDGSLTLDEYCEMTKFAFPPYTRAAPIAASASTKSAGGKSADGTTASSSSAQLTAFSLEEMARRRLIDPGSIRLPALSTPQIERPYILHPALNAVGYGVTSASRRAGGAASRADLNRERLIRLLGKSPVDSLTSAATARRQRMRKLQPHQYTSSVDSILDHPSSPSAEATLANEPAATSSAAAAVAGLGTRLQRYHHSSAADVM